MLKAFQCRELWMQSVIVAAVAVTIITINKESLFLPYNCLWNVPLVETGSTAFPESEIFPISCDVISQSSVKYAAPAPPMGKLRGNSFLGRHSPSCSCFHQHCAHVWEAALPACSTGHHQSVDEDLFSAGFWNDAAGTVSQALVPWAGKKKKKCPNTCVAVLGKGMDFLLLQTSCCSCKVVQKEARYGPTHPGPGVSGTHSCMDYQVILAAHLSLC